MTQLHASIRNLDMPARMRRLPLTENGWPSLFFAATVEGKLDLRVMDPRKWEACIKRKLCWLCGQPLGQFKVWPIGPMCVVNRVSAEPPSHRDCAEYAVKACPFLTRPHARRREAAMPEKGVMAGFGIERNPGVAALWTARSYKVFKAGAGGKGYLLQLGDPIDVRWFAEGRQATAAEVRAAIDSGVVLLREVSEKEGPESVAELERQIERAKPLLPS